MIYLDKILLKTFSFYDPLYDNRTFSFFVKLHNVLNSGNKVPPLQENYSLFRRVTFQI